MWTCLNERDRRIECTAFNVAALVYVTCGRQTRVDDITRAGQAKSMQFDIPFPRRTATPAGQLEYGANEALNCSAHVDVIELHAIHREVQMTTSTYGGQCHDLKLS